MAQSLARQAVSEYVTIAEKYGMTPTELALAWCYSRWFVTSTIIGATTLDQLKVGVQMHVLSLSECALPTVQREDCSA